MSKNKDNMTGNSQFLLYQTEDGQTRIEVRLENETVWMTQAMMAELYRTTPQNITLHLKAMYSECELDEAATCKDYLRVQEEDSREVFRPFVAVSINVALTNLYWRISKLVIEDVLNGEIVSTLSRQFTWLHRWGSYDCGVKAIKEVTI